MNRGLLLSLKKKVSKEIFCETVFRLCVLRDRSQTCPFLFFLSLPPWGKVPPKGADEGAGSRPLSCRGAHCAPAVFNPNSAAGAGPRPTPFVGRGRPGLPRLRRRGGTLGRPPPNRRTPPKLPIYVSKRPTKGSIPPYLSSPKAFPPQGGRCPSAHTGADEGEFLRRSASLIPTLISQPRG